MPLGLHLPRDASLSGGVPPSSLARDVKQQDRHAGVGELRGYAGAHRSGSEDCGLFHDGRHEPSSV